MTSEVVTISVFAAVCFLVGIVYWFSPFFTKSWFGKNDPFERKIFRQNLPFWQFMLMTVFAPLMTFLVVMLVNQIVTRPNVYIFPMGDRPGIWLGVLSLLMIAYGAGAHGASVSISHYMAKQKHTKAYDAVEFYHHVLSHFLGIIGMLLLFSVIALIELGHPLYEMMNNWDILLLLISGLIMGVFIAFIIIEGRGKYYGIPGLAVGIAMLSMINYDLDLNLRYYPVVVLTLATFVIALLTVIFWRMKNGELKETMGEFFHLEDD